MQEVFSGGYAVEYICRVIDQTDGKESVPETATVAQTNLNGKGSGGKGGKKGADNASQSKTNAYLNSALQVAMPALNGVTDGVAAQVVGKSRQIVNVGSKIASGAGTAAIFGALAPLIAWGVSEAIQKIQNDKAKNDATAQSIDKTNVARTAAGLDKINYTRTGITGKIRMEVER